MKTITVLYFAALKEKAARSEEVLNTTAETPSELYNELMQRYQFALKPVQVKVAINDEFQTHETELKSGDQVAFIPPISGG